MNETVPLISSRAPVAMFVYNRLDNTRETMKHLLANTLAKETDLYVFSDGGRDEVSWMLVEEVRRFLRETQTMVRATKAMHSMMVIERPENYYLERNIMQGISFVLQRHESVIVLEDDIMTSPYFLSFMNQALTLYRDCPKVMHVSGFSNLDLREKTDKDFYFSNHMAGWGWATWRNRWQPHFRYFRTEEEALEGLTAKDISAIEYNGAFPCLKNLKKRPIPWDVCWELAIHRAKGVCLMPVHTLVRNTGLQTGTHFRSCRLVQYFEYDRWPLFQPLTVTRVENPAADPQTEELMKAALTHWGIRYTLLGRILRAPLLFFRHVCQKKTDC